MGAQSRYGKTTLAKREGILMSDVNLASAEEQTFLRVKKCASSIFF